MHGHQSIYPHNKAHGLYKDVQLNPPPSNTHSNETISSIGTLLVTGPIASSDSDGTVQSAGCVDCRVAASLSTNSRRVEAATNIDSIIPFYFMHVSMPILILCPTSQKNYNGKEYILGAIFLRCILCGNYCNVRGIIVAQFTLYNNM